MTSFPLISILYIIDGGGFIGAFYPYKRRGGFSGFLLANVNTGLA